MTSNQISKNITVLNRFLHLMMARSLKPLGIGMGQYPYVIAVCKHPGISQDGLTGQLLFNKSSVARATAQLEEGGFLTRETHPTDKRAYQLYPTHKGEQTCVIIQELLAGYVDELMESFTQEERETADRLLARMGDVAANLSAGVAAEAKQNIRELE